MRTIAAHFGPREHDLKPEMRFDLFAKALQWLAKKLFHFAAAEADHVRMLLLAPGLIIVLLPGLVHKIELVDQAALLEQLQCAVDGDAIQLRVFLFRELIKTLRVEMLARLVDEVEQDLPLARQTHTALGESSG
jgi:hypothetical protein